MTKIKMTETKTAASGGQLREKVKICIEVLEEVGQNKPKPKPLGKYHLGKELDKMNVRDFAYEEN